MDGGVFWFEEGGSVREELVVVEECPTNGDGIPACTTALDEGELAAGGKLIEDEEGPTNGDEIPACKVEVTTALDEGELAGGKLIEEGPTNGDEGPACEVEGTSDLDDLCCNQKQNVKVNGRKANACIST